MENGRRVFVAGIDGFGVFDERKRDDAAVLVKKFFERIESNPEVVGVEEPMARDVLEILRIGFGALDRFTQEEFADSIFCEMAAFFVGFGSGGDFHHERFA